MTIIRYNGLKINSLSNSSGLFIGTNHQNRRISRREISQGFGSVEGESGKVMNNCAFLQKKPTKRI
ncbi:hypothetical protein D1B31_07910 [Neobacillus notoginsengisoli]|uniref:Uncharacterized protein n=1 Tax=Neobacillus notoginsengisoli TaxID=1578198 RepID=A0A417YW36_9BACI|nr:hypothetical protein D1B31_07910 [Neobacillus notoginsengisoli]